MCLLTALADDVVASLGDLQVQDVRWSSFFPFISYPGANMTQGDTIYATTDRNSIAGVPGYPEYGDSAREMNTVAFDIQILNSAAL